MENFRNGLGLLYPGIITTGAAVATAVAVTIATLALVKQALFPKRGPVIPSPLPDILMGRKPSAVDELEQAPDEFPGSRDVETPVGI